MGLIGIGIIIVLVIVCIGLSAVVYVTSSSMLARLMDYATVKKTDISMGGTLVLLAIGFFFLFFKGTAMIGVAIFAVLAGYYLIRFKGGFLKVLIAKIIAIPVILLHFVSSFISGHRAQSAASYGGKATTRDINLPQQIRTGNWDMQCVYDQTGLAVYENYDGMRCLVDHKRKFSKALESNDYLTNAQYDVTPLYNINDPLPGWIRWLY